MQTFCPKHFTLEDIDCEEPIVACPPRVPLDPTKHLIVTCGPCERTRVVPIERVMQGTVRASGTCVLSSCAATILAPEVADMTPPRPAKKAKPA